MRSRFRLVVLAIIAPSMATAQEQIALSAFSRSPSAALRSRNLEPLCDGTEIRRVEVQQNVGKIMAFTGAAVGLLGILAVHTHPQRGLPIVLTAGALGLGGGFIAATAYPSEAFWQVTLARAQTGLTTPDDVRSCLHEPSGTSTAGTEEQLIYRVRPSGAFAWGHRLADVRFTFKDGVLTEVRRAEGRALRAEGTNKEGR
jgi:hypothetical protein